MSERVGEVEGDETPRGGASDRTQRSEASVGGGGSGGGAAAFFAAVRSREGIVLLFALACLTILMEYSQQHVFRNEVRPHLPPLPDSTLVPFVWTAFLSVLTRMVAPLLLIVLVLRESPLDFGYRPVGSRTFWRIYGALAIVMVPIVWIAAGTPEFQQKYPLWPGARETWSGLLLYELRYFFIFLSGESFWRGFLLFGLARRFGWHALSIAMVPYVMVHFGKPAVETLGAVVTAYVLGYLALKHRSFWPGVALHFTVALAMDLAAMLRSGRLPDVW